MAVMRTGPPKMRMKSKKGSKRKREIKLKISLRKSADGIQGEDKGRNTFITVILLEGESK